MGVAEFALRTTAATAKEKRKKTPKPQSRYSSARPDTSKMARKKKKEKKARYKPPGPGTRSDTHQKLPIIIESDEDIDADKAPVAGASVVTRACSLPASTASRIFSRANRFSTEALNVASSADPILSVYSSSAASLRQKTAPPGLPHPRYSGKQHSFEKRLRSVKPSPCASVANKSPAQRRIQREQSPNARTSTRKPGLFDHYAGTSSSAPLFADGGIELTLTEIPDSELREKTAKIMAIAPELPMVELYHFLKEKKGRVEDAKQGLFNASQIPFTPPSAGPAALARAATVPLTKLMHMDDDEMDEPYIKINPEDSAFKWDNDVPVTPPPETSRQRQNRQARPKRLTPKSFGRPNAKAQRPKSADNCVPKAFRKQTANPTKDALKGSYAKRPKGKSAGDINCGMRETSSDRSFIVSDDEEVEKSDDTYYDSDVSATSASESDTSEDGTDLR